MQASQCESEWKILCMLVKKIVCLSYPVALPKSVQPTCSRDTDVVPSVEFLNFLLQMICQCIEETSKDSTLVSWWVQREAKQRLWTEACTFAGGSFFVLDSLHRALWWLINPLDSDFPLRAPKTSEVSKISSRVKFPKCTVLVVCTIRPVKQLTGYLKLVYFVFDKVFDSLALP